MPSDELKALLADVFPGAHILRTRTLRGGIGAYMLAVSLELTDGSRQSVSVRRLRPHDLRADPGGLEYEFTVLQLLDRTGINAPRPLSLDAVGKHFGDPALVMTFLPGRLNLTPIDTAPWTDALAGALARIHEVAPNTADLSVLKPLDNSQRIDDIAGDLRSDPLAAEVVEVLRKYRDRIEPLPPTLIHNDYWSGNTIWNRGHLTGVIDWTHARLGDPRHDLSDCRGALVFDHDEETANQFLAAYELRSGRRLRDIWFFDLIRAVVAYLWHDLWLEGYRDLGIELRASDVKKRLATFLRHAIDSARVSA